LDKVRLLDAFRALLQERLREAEAAQKLAADGTRVDGTHRPANRGERAAVSSQGYLAAGLGQRIETMQRHLMALERLDLKPKTAVGAGSLVQFEDEEGRRAWWLLVPGGEGMALTDGAHSARVVSPESPIGRALLELEVGDETTLNRPGGAIKVDILQIR
jgi:transcription elongation GreA/GreB family factor